MNAYLASVHKRWEERLQQATEAVELKEVYQPYTQKLADKIRSWLNELDAEYHNSTFYECDLCQMFKCKKEDLAIASSSIPLYSQVITVNGIRVRSYSLVPFTASLLELNDVQLFMMDCLQRGYITAPQNGWLLIIPSVNLYEAFVHSEQYQGTSRLSFGRNLSKMGFAKAVLAGNPPYRCRSFKLKQLDEARHDFATIILGDEKYRWE